MPKGNLKKLVHDRMAKTGETYQAAFRHVKAEAPELEAPSDAVSLGVEADAQDADFSSFLSLLKEAAEEDHGRGTPPTLEWKQGVIKNYLATPEDRLKLAQSLYRCLTEIDQGKVKVGSGILSWDIDAATQVFKACTPEEQGLPVLRDLAALAFKFQIQTDLKPTNEVRLNAAQRQYLSNPYSEASCRWMHSQEDTDRRTGRTTILALWLLIQAWEKPGKKIEVKAPEGSQAAHAALMLAVRMWVERFACEPFMSFSKTALSVNPPDNKWQQAKTRVLANRVEQVKDFESQDYFPFSKGMEKVYRPTDPTLSKDKAIFNAAQSAVDLATGLHPSSVSPQDLENTAQEIMELTDNLEDSQDFSSASKKLALAVELAKSHVPLGDYQTLRSTALEYMRLPLNAVIERLLAQK